jgi:fructose-1-phosphate kinase PfkB-like protein
MLVCVSGNPSVDKLLEVDDLLPGEIQRPRFFMALPAGRASTSLESGPELVKINGHEAQELLGYDVDDVASARELAAAAEVRPTR